MTPTDSTHTILFAGGGTGGHLYPALAVAERLAMTRPSPRVHYACSNRVIDAAILTEARADFTALSIRPLPTKPWHIPVFLASYFSSRRRARAMLRELNIAAVVSMGGFVSGPVVAAARGRVPLILVNLDATPGKANRLLAKKCDFVYSVYPSDVLPPGTLSLALPLRLSCISAGDRQVDRAALGIDDPSRPVLLVTGASQGAESINTMMIELTRSDAFRSVASQWTIVHLAGRGNADRVARAYDDASLSHVTMEFCHAMGHAWGSADLAITRAGAGSVAEAAANKVPAIFLPYPYHKDQHQRLNALPLVHIGGALLHSDLIDPIPNARSILDTLIDLMSSSDRRLKMREVLESLNSADGAAALAGKILHLIDPP